MDVVLPIGFVVFAWWASTGLVLLLDTLPRPTHRWSVLGSGLLGLGALYGLAATADRTGIPDAYIAFTCALVVWGCQELAFLTGIVTGPRKGACPVDCTGWRHFLHGCEAILYHELLVIAAAAAVFLLSWGQPNPVGAWTFLVLWVMRQSAKLNLHLGVRNLGLEFLPPHLRHLACYFRRRPMNPLLPFSVGIPAIVLYQMAVAAAGHVGAPFDRTAIVLVGTLLGLAILEHLLLVVPVPASRLWGRRNDPAGDPPAVEAVAVKTL